MIIIIIIIILPRVIIHSHWLSLYAFDKLKEVHHQIHHNYQNNHQHHNHNKMYDHQELWTSWARLRNDYEEPRTLAKRTKVLSGKPCLHQRDNNYNLLSPPGPLINWPNRIFPSLQVQIPNTIFLRQLAIIMIGIFPTQPVEKHKVTI